MPGALMSSVYRPLPVTNLKSSRRRNGWPTYLIAVASVMAMRLRGEGLNCAYDVGVAGTAADIAGKVMADFTLGRMRVLLEQLVDSHDHPRSTETALQGVVLMESRLNRMQSAIAARESFDRRDRRTVRHHGETRPGFDRLSIDINCAVAALRGDAADIDPREAQIS